MENVRQCVGVTVKQSHGVGRTVHQAFLEFPDDIKGRGEEGEGERGVSGGRRLLSFTRVRG